METVMATVTSTGGSTLAPKNNGGSAKGVGTSTVLNNLSVARPVVTEDDSQLNDISGGPEVLNLTTAQRVSSTLVSGGTTPDLFQGIHKYPSSTTATLFTKGLRDGHWNSVSGVWDTGYPQTTTETYATDDINGLAFKSSSPTIGSGSYPLG